MNHEISSKGILYVVSLPIGNLRDITLRAIDTLRSVSAVVCEDTRVTNKIFDAYGINNMMIQCYGSGSGCYMEKAINILESGKNVALVTDAGTPLISDPGYEIVLKAINLGFKVMTVPGPCSVISALSISGIECSRFIFYGFLPTKEAQLKTELEKILSHNIATIVFESPARLLSTLSLLASIAGDRVICVARELTKLFEEAIRCTVTDMLKEFSNRDVIKGEIIIIFSPNADNYVEEEQRGFEIAKKLREEGCAIKVAISEAISSYPKLKKNKLYEYLLGLK